MSRRARRYRGGMSDHLRPVPDEGEDDLARRFAEDLEHDPWESGAPIVRPSWWRWVALAVVIALVVATPVAYAWSVLVR